MISFMSLYYDSCVLEPLWHELWIKIKINSLTIVLFILVYSSFVSFVSSMTKILLNDVFYGCILELLCDQTFMTE
jgi:hypothetical protein